MTDSRSVNISGTALIWAIALMFCCTVTGVVLLSVFVRDSAALVAQLLGAFATLTVALGTLFKVGRVEQKVDDQAEVVDRAAEAVEQVREQTNGNLHRAVREISYESVTRALADRLDKP